MFNRWLYHKIPLYIISLIIDIYTNRLKIHLWGKTGIPKNTTSQLHEVSKPGFRHIIHLIFIYDWLKIMFQPEKTKPCDIEEITYNWKSEKSRKDKLTINITKFSVIILFLIWIIYEIITITTKTENVVVAKEGFQMILSLIQIFKG